MGRSIRHMRLPAIDTAPPTLPGVNSGEHPGKVDDGASSDAHKIEVAQPQEQYEQSARSASCPRESTGSWWGRVQAAVERARQCHYRWSWIGSRAVARGGRGPEQRLATASASRGGL